MTEPVSPGPRLHALVLPESISWLTEKVTGLLRWSAFVRPGSSGTVAAQGATRSWGLPDLPADAPWAQFEPHTQHPSLMPWAWRQAPQDGESFVLQLDLAEIPDDVRKPHWPAQGVVWVFIDLSEDWKGTVRFDPRARADIPWQPRLDAMPPRAPRWYLEPRLPAGTDQTLPEISQTWRDEGGGLLQEYEDWAWKALNICQPSDFQVGGWVSPCQGDFDQRNERFVCGLVNQPFGDAGCVYLQYDVERGFSVQLDTH